MKAIGIPRISNDIAGISKKDAAKMSLLAKEKIHRGSGPVDLLTGIDQARMHIHRRDETIRTSSAQEFTAWMGGIWNNNQQESRHK